VQLSADEAQQYRAALVHRIRAERALAIAAFQAAKAAHEDAAERVAECEARLSAAHGVDFSRDWHLTASGALEPTE